MGQASLREKPWCCSCSSKPASANPPVQFILEPTQSTKHETGSNLSTASSSPKASIENRVVSSEPPLPPPAFSPEPEIPPVKPLELAPSAKELEKSPKRETGQDSGQLWGSDPFATLESVSSPFATLEYEDMTKQQKNSAKAFVKDFVKAMVKGQHFTAVLPSGKTKDCFCALNRNLDKFQIRAHEKDRRGRTISLASVEEIVVGTEVSGSVKCAGLSTPLDEMCVTLALETDECLTFRLEDRDARDKLAVCLTMFSDQAKTAH